MGEWSGRVRRWLFDAALPLWAEKGVDEHGFVEQLDHEGRPDETTRRVRVAARQVYVFAEAARLGWSPGAAIAERGFDRLVRSAWLGPQQGWARLLSLQGEVIDRTAELYDIAFVLFAAAALNGLTGDPAARRAAHATLDFLDGRMRLAEGFRESLGGGGPRQQNPHMHLMEAALAWTALGEERFSGLADQLADLFAQRLFDPASGTLGEFFSEDWRTAPAEETVRCVEPGHHFEWVWLVAELKRLRGRDLTPAAVSLYDFAERHGIEPQSGGVRNGVTETGAPLDRSSRAWTNCERIKAGIAITELTGRDARAGARAGLAFLFDHNLARPLAGSWSDTIAPDGRSDTDPVRASTFYHLMLAFSEVLRVEATLDL